MRDDSGFHQTMCVDSASRAGQSIPLKLYTAAALLMGFAGAQTWSAEGPAAQASNPAAAMAALSKSPPFTAQQVAQGHSVYQANCALCHAPDLSGGSSERPLKGRAFRSLWGGGASTGALFKYMRENMPPGRAGTLSAEDYAAVIALLLSESGLKAGADPLPATYEALQGFHMPYAGDTSGGLAVGYKLPAWPAKPNPAATLTSVTDQMLRDPPVGDWLTWRRTLDGLGFSPLKQITNRNVRGLRLAWTFKIDSATNIGTPLVHEGVMFVQAGNDNVQALDAATGELLWRYIRPGASGGAGVLGYSGRRTISLYQDKLYLGTSDNNVVALNARTGEQVWETKLPASGPGGPFAINGMVIQGLGRGAIRGEKTCGSGGRILGMNASDGKLQWSFNTVAQPGEFGVDSWNDLPCANRSGAGEWTPITYYDPDLNLIFAGTGNDYDTKPFTNPAVKSPSTATALFNNTTLALNPQTGKLVWHYQHMGGELWDMDWVFEQQIIPLSVDGKVTKTIVTMGKPGILDAVDAATGRYLFSLDSGLQNMVQSIDPTTGAKNYSPEATPGGETKFLCPQIHGVKNWLPASYNPNTRVLYEALQESCMTMTPIPASEMTPFSSQVTYHIAPRPHSDGKIGRVQAYDLKKRKLLWNTRQRAPWTSGILDTAGGVFFTGSLDRQFTAHNDHSGEALWTARLADVPTGAPITFSVNGKQYIAVLTGWGAPITKGFLELVPEIDTPLKPDASVYVFALEQ